MAIQTISVPAEGERQGFLRSANMLAVQFGEFAHYLAVFKMVQWVCGMHIRRNGDKAFAHYMQDGRVACNGCGGSNILGLYDFP